jgi:hypothetical protein
MKRVLVSFAFGLCLFGQGCLGGPTVGPSQTGETPSVQPSTEGFVAFRDGFGPLPGPRPLGTGAKFETTWSTELPSLPNEVTVLRQHTATPDRVLLQNITTALRIPAGVLGDAADASALSLSWRDGANTEYGWSYDAVLNHVSFRRVISPNALTTSSLIDDAQLIQSAKLFLVEHGVDSTGWGKPEIRFSWYEWWNRMQNENRCMDKTALEFIRVLSKDGDTQPVDARVTPTLPKRDNSVRCMNPEFPALQPVTFAASRDEQTVVGWKAEPVPAALIAMDTRKLSVQQGWFELSQELDRSNYPSLSTQEVAKRLRDGGMFPFSSTSTNVIVGIDTFSIGLYKHAPGSEAQPFFIPALLASGKATYADGTTKNYATIVPLVRDEEYAGQ